MDVPTIKPSIKKVFIYDIMKVLSAVFLLIALILFLNYFNAFDDLVPVFETLGMDFNINTTAVFVWFIGVALAIAAVLLTINYLILFNVRYEFYPDKIVKYKTAFFVLINSEDISYGNISRVSYDNSGLINWLLRTGIVNIELTGIKRDSLKMEFMDNPQNVIQYIQRCTTLYKSRNYAEHAENYKIGKIIDREQY